MATPVDLRRCPNCGRDGFHLVSEERLQGQALIYLDGDPEEGFTATWAGETEIIWDTSTTVGYRCGHCNIYLPEAYQAEIDRLLGNPRERRMHKAPPTAPDEHLEQL